MTSFTLDPPDKQNFLSFRIDNLGKNREYNYRLLSKKVHIQGGVFFQERGHTYSMPSV